MSDYGQSEVGNTERIDAPELDYRPPRPRSYAPNIGLIGCGGISEYHLAAYRESGLNVTALCDVNEANARERRDAFYPDAAVTTDFRELLARDDIEVVDAATHPAPRREIIEAALNAKKHVLSQKPFVTDLDEGERLCDLADSNGVKLAVNQNGRWAPHFAWMREAIAAGLLGDVSSVDVTMQFDHTWTAGTPFEEMHHLLLYDFAIHWFDIATVFMGEREASAVYASVQRTRYQQIKPPFLAQVVADYEGAQLRMGFNAHTRPGQEDRTIVCGAMGTMRAWGPKLNEQDVHLWTDAGHASPALEGDWFSSGFQGTMGELLCAVEEDRQPFNNARDNLRSLALGFAALHSADTGLPQRPGSVRQV